MVAVPAAAVPNALGVAIPKDGVAPVAPVGPVGPATVLVAPVAPVGPALPVGPVGPVGPTIAPASVQAVPDQT